MSGVQAIAQIRAELQHVPVGGEGQNFLRSVFIGRRLATLRGPAPHAPASVDAALAFRQAMDVYPDGHFLLWPGIDQATAGGDVETPSPVAGRVGRRADDRPRGKVRSAVHRWA